MEQICHRVAGLDVHRDQVAVCVRTPGPRAGVHVEKARFKTTTAELAVLAGWLAEREVALVAMRLAPSPGRPSSGRPGAG